jgi:hypothetical protein
MMMAKPLRMICAPQLRVGNHCICLIDELHFGCGLGAWIEVRVVHLRKPPVSTFDNLRFGVLMHLQNIIIITEFLVLSSHFAAAFDKIPYYHTTYACEKKQYIC